MSYGRLVVLGLGVGCLFGMIGPLNILMLPPTRNPSWLAIFLLTFFCGASAFSLFAFFRNLFIGIPAVILFFSASFFTGPIEEFLTGSRTLDRVGAVITSKRPPESPADYNLTDDQPRSYNQKRTTVGLLAVILLGSGYGLIIVAVTKESRERARWQRRCQSPGLSKGPCFPPYPSGIVGVKLPERRFLQQRSGEITLTLFNYRGMSSLLQLLMSPDMALAGGSLGQ